MEIEQVEHDGDRGCLGDTLVQRAWLVFRIKGVFDMKRHISDGQLNEGSNCGVGRVGILLMERFTVFCHLLSRC